MQQGDKPFRCILVYSSLSIIEINKQLIASYPFQVEVSHPQTNTAPQSGAVNEQVVLRRYQSSTTDKNDR